MESSSCDIYQMSSLLRSRSLGSVLDSVSGLSQSSLSEPLPRAVIFLIVKLRRGFSQLSFVYVLFSFNIFLITYFCVVSSFEPPLDHNSDKDKTRALHTACKICAVHHRLLSNKRSEEN